MNYQPLDVLNKVVFPCARGTYLLSERPSLEGVHAALCAKEITRLLNNSNLILDVFERAGFEDHDEGKAVVASWAKKVKLDFQKEIDISVGVADVLVYGDDIGIFEIGTTRPTKMILLLTYIAKQTTPYTVHFWPYGSKKAIVFRNWK